MHNNPNQKHHIPSLLIVICLIIFSVACLILRGDVVWKQNTKPIAPEVVTPQIVEKKISLQYCGLTINAPFAQDVITFPYTLNATWENKKEVTGCNWTVFEGQLASIKVLDGSGKKIGGGLLKVEEGIDWMKMDTFNAHSDLELTDKKVELKSGTNLMIVIDEENPSDSKNSKQIRIPVVVK